MTTTDKVNAAVARGDFAGAAKVAEAALAVGERDPLLFNVLAYVRSEAGRHEEAIELLLSGLALAPRDGLLHYARGFSLEQLGRDAEAIAAYDAALDIDPAAPAPLCHKAMIYERAGEDAAADGYYRAACAADPKYEDPWAGLASLAVRRGDLEAAETLARQCLALAPGNAAAHLALARADLQQNRPQAAVTRLAGQLNAGEVAEADQPAYYALMGDALDALGRTEPAFAAWSRGKALVAQRYRGSELERAAHAHLERLEALAPFVEALPAFPPVGAAEVSAHDPAVHVFLIGFPRSGTTLLEQVLASHPRIVTLEERPLLEGAEVRYLASPATFDDLAAAPEQALARLRADYWAGVRGHGVEPAGRVFVDKLPLASLLIPLIVRLFPNARFLFAERDPRDVVLSAFRRAFRVNPGMFQFVSLERTARFYAAVMRLALQYRRLAGERVLPVRYERLVEDLEARAREICAFLGLDFDPQMLAFQETARGRVIRTPSASQVRAPLSARPVQHWRGYAAQLAPVASTLAPYVETLGYEP